MAKSESLESRFPATQQGLNAAFEERNVLWKKYEEKYHELQAVLPTLPIGADFRAMKKAAEEPIRQIAKLERRIVKVMWSLEMNPLKDFHSLLQ